MGATIIRLLLNTGYYLRKRVFFKHAIAHHLSFVITVPPMALLIAFILSLVQVSFVISDVTLHLDMNNVYISIVVAALIGIAPWKAWDFVSTLADKLFERITPSPHDEEQSPADTASDSS